MATIIVSPDFLSPLTTVTQCMDNQFVPQELFPRIAGSVRLRDILKGVLQGQEDDLIESYRQSSQVEYIRGLLYSRRVVLNRNAFWNTPLLISSALGSDREGLVTLLAANAIVPYLYREDTFEQEPTFDVLPKGREAVESLARDPELARLVCVRLGGDDQQENRRKTDDMTINFRQQLTYFLDADTGDVQERALSIAGILLRGKKSRPAEKNALANKIQELAEWVRKERPSRNTLYKNFVTKGDNPSDGLYRQDPFTFELKVWIDLIYNSNLPRHLGVLTFVPRGFPTPLDVGLIWPIRARKTRHEEASDVLQHITKRAGSHAIWKAWDVVKKNAKLSIPSPHQLTHIDIVEIRGWEEWKYMMEGMKAYLDDPVEERSIQGFYSSYNEFLRKLSAWWLARNANARKQWVSGVAKVYRIGKWFVGFLVVAKQLFPLLPPIDVDFPPLPPDEVIEVTVETGLYLFERGQTDWRRTQLVRSLRTAQDINREELLRTWESIKKLYPDLPDRYPGHDLSDQLATEEG